MGQEGITDRDLILYTYPTDEDLARVGVTGIFLGHYIPWDSIGNAFIAQAHGLETYPHAVEGSLVNYENLDNLQMRIHDYFKFIKYGFGRVTDWACIYIRRGRLGAGRAGARCVLQFHADLQRCDRCGREGMDESHGRERRGLRARPRDSDDRRRRLRRPRWARQFRRGRCDIRRREHAHKPRQRGRRTCG